MSQAGVVDEVLDPLEEREFWASVDEGYARLRQDADAWFDYTAEREEWVVFGLTDEPA